MGNLNCKCNEEAIQQEPEMPQSNLTQEKVKIPHISNLKQSFHNNINISPTLYSTYESENSMIKSSRKSFGSISDIDDTNKSHIVSSRCLSKSSYQVGLNQEFVYKPKITEAFLQARNDFKKSNGYAETPAPFLEKDFKSTSSLFQRRKLFEKKLQNLKNQN
ncbi:hypothetical protein PPERSA_00203 [Pseudocohnilembus persalinus]|uniref:Uncharacterized protein n=1 Tax=Pseudocohnilembus persalinus TaxID=266149 RepID=A0A0V0QQ63_PSEPJ|nr:hypothetical protein PPERSA_00203 [Pseudocohnilembus persalinus]|eukprot:KRX04434.1 hypothetical protein PPERSA_00203 [Pseudocohnilembus persalinus]